MPHILTLQLDYRGQYLGSKVNVVLAFDPATDMNAHTKRLLFNQRVNSKNVKQIGETTVDVDQTLEPVVGHLAQDTDVSIA